MLLIKRGISIPSDAVDEAAYDNLPAALQWIHENSLQQDAEHFAQVQTIAAEFPLLEGVEVEYWEARQEHLVTSGLSERDQAAISANFLTHPCAVLMYPIPKLIIGSRLSACPIPEQEMMIRHELVHLEQTVRGDSLLVEEGQTWKGEIYPKEFLMNINGGIYQNDPHALYIYHRLPWEVEAFIRSEGEDAYLYKLRLVQLAHLIQEALPADHGHAPLDLANAAYNILEIGFEIEAKNELSASPSGELLAEVLSVVPFELSRPEGEGVWSVILTLLEREPDSIHLSSPADAWAVLIEACLEFRKRYPRGKKL